MGERIWGTNGLHIWLPREGHGDHEFLGRGLIVIQGDDGSQHVRRGAEREHERAVLTLAVVGERERAVGGLDDDAEEDTRAPQRPEEVRIFAGGCRDEGAGCGHDAGGEELVDEQAVQLLVAADSRAEGRTDDAGGGADAEV